MITHLTFNKLIKFQNDRLFQHYGFINADKKFIETFLSKKWGYKKGIIEMIF